MSNTWLQIRDLRRTYRRGRQEVHALDGVSLELSRGEFLTVVGSSGSGKSTLLHLLAGLDTPTAGEIRVDGHDLHRLSLRERAAFRARRVGIVFQSFHLLPQHSALKNVELALYFRSLTTSQRRERAREVLERLGLGERLHHRPAALSGGEQQRVALARALVKEPALLLADEPTGNLDRENSLAIAGHLSALHREGLTVVMATHDTEMAAALAERTLRLHYGRLAAGRPQAEERSP